MSRNNMLSSDPSRAEAEPRVESWTTILKEKEGRFNSFEPMTESSRLYLSQPLTPL